MRVRQQKILAESGRRRLALAAAAVAAALSLLLVGSQTVRAQGEPQAEEADSEEGVSSADAAATDEAALARAAQNPIAALYSVPMQNNMNLGIGPHNRIQNVLNIQPVIPAGLGSWNLINRTIIPLIWQPDVARSSGGTFGLGDINYTGFFSPPAMGVMTWGFGPAVLFPTATDPVLGTGKWSIGPSAIIVLMPGRWVIGALVNNVWSVGGDSDRADVNAMLIQYFINYNLPLGWYLTSAPIVTANWEADREDRWIVPFGAGVGRVFKVGSQPLNVQVAGFWNAIRPDNVPSADWQLRLQLTFLFPR